MNDTENTGNDTGNQEAAQSGESNQGGGLDSSGLEAFIVQGFDPTVHMTGGDGKPLLTVTGELRRKPGRKKGGQVAAQMSASAPGTAPGQRKKTKLEEKSEQMSADAVAAMLCAMGTETLSKLIGPEWHFEDEAEKVTVQAALAAYIRAKGDKFELSPEWMLALVLVGYGTVRLQHENTRSKLGRFWGVLKNGFKRVFGRGG